MSPQPAVFLDRDGVLNELVYDPRTSRPESPLKVEDVRLIEGAPAALRGLRRAGFELVCVSNQPAAAKGRVSLAQLLAVHERVLDLLVGREAPIMASRLCFHHPEGVVSELSGPCDCRKPAAGMLYDLAAELQLDLSSSWMVGDTDADVGAGRTAGCRTLLVENRGSAHKRTGAFVPDLRAPSLLAGATQLMASGRRAARFAAVPGGGESETAAARGDLARAAKTQ